VIACVQNTLWYFVVLVVVVVLAGILGLGVQLIVVLLLVRLLLDCILLSYFLFLSISFCILRLLHLLRSSISVDSALDFSIFQYFRTISKSVPIDMLRAILLDMLCRPNRGIVVRTLLRLLAFRAGSAFVILLLRKYCLFCHYRSICGRVAPPSSFKLQA
jgi:hypothetical protein